MCTQRMLVDFHLHFGPQHHGLPIKMRPPGRPETSVNCQNMLCCLPEGHRTDSIKFHANLTSGSVLIHADRTDKTKPGGGVRDYAKESNENRWMSATIFIPPPHTQLQSNPHLKCTSKRSRKNHVTSNGGNNEP